MAMLVYRSVFQINKIIQVYEIALGMISGGAMID